MMSSGKSRIKMRPPRNRDAVDVNFDDSWTVLATAMQEMYRKNASRLSYEELYRTAYTLVLKKHAERLYGAFKLFVAAHLREMVLADLVPLASNTANSLAGTGDIGSTLAVPLAAGDQREGGIRFLKAVKSQWEDHCLCMRMISDILMYMDRVYCKELQLPLIYDAGLALFRDNVIRNPDFQVGEHIYAIILDQIKLQRQGDIIDTSSIKAIVLMLESLPEDKQDGETVYSRSFEPKFLHSSNEFYQSEAEKLSRDCNSSQYLIETEKRLQQEHDRAMSYLSLPTEPKVTKIIEESLITKNIVSVMKSEQSGLTVMIENDRFDDLSRLYRLSKRVDPDKTELRSELNDLIISQGSDLNRDADQEITKDPQHPKKGVSAQTAATTAAFKWVEAVLSLKDKYDKILNETMESDNQVQTSLTNAMSAFINRMPRSSEFLSLFIDENLKKGLKGKTEDEAEAVLDRAITLFRYIADKDVFETYYKTHLAKRLLGGRSVSDDTERLMITKLKMEVGFSFTTKLEGMFKDMKLSSDMMQEFKSDSSIELALSVLTSTNWPVSLSSTENSTCMYPAEIEQVKRSFEKFYMDRHSGRVLNWNPNMGTADVRATFKKRKHEINVSTYAMVILMLFNRVPDGGSLTYAEIKAATSIPDMELVRNLQSLAVVPKTRILLKEPMSKEINLTDRFFFNAGFESQYIRIKIPTVAYINKTETDAERKDTVDKVDAQRRYQTDAAIVRIMKARKTLEHNILVSEVTAQLATRFKPDAVLIKKRIDAMLEREYIERSTDSRQVYNYLA
ncbi:Cullin [Lipomyces oligophaga]|uniref:Cullin n=1 Tax=Lipomyces oligophaga TaxID=45792 RepID=UPI0034CE7CA9